MYSNGLLRYKDIHRKAYGARTHANGIHVWSHSVVKSWKGENKRVTVMVIVFNTTLYNISVIS